MNNSIQPIVTIHVVTELDGEAEAQVYGKRVSWVNACMVAAFLAALAAAYVLVMW